VSKPSKIPAEIRNAVKLLKYQQDAVDNPARFTWSNWSRQTGKSFALSLRRLLRGALERRRLQVLLSAGERQSRELMLKVQQHVRALNIVADYCENNFFEDTQFKQLELTLPNQVRVIALPANPNTARGFTGDAFLDEFAIHQHDREIWGALFATVTRGRGELDIGSTPKGKDNMFAALKDNPSFSHSTVTIYDAVRDGLDVDPEELRIALGDDEIWRQEFLCEFLDEATAFLTYQMIAACESDTLPPPIKIDGDDVSLAIEAIARLGAKQGKRSLGHDVARGGIDRAVFWLTEQIGAALVTPLVVELKNCPFRRQRALLDAFLKEGQVDRVAIDSTGLGMQLAEDAVADYGAWRIDPVTFTLAVKDKLAGQLRIHVEDRSMLIPADQDIRNDWHSIKRTVTTGGMSRYLADRIKSGHADRFWAAGLAVDAGSADEGWNGEGLVTGDVAAQRDASQWEPDEHGDGHVRITRRSMAGCW